MNTQSLEPVQMENDYHYSCCFGAEAVKKRPDSVGKNHTHTMPLRSESYFKRTGQMILNLQKYIFDLLIIISTLHV